MHFWCIIEGACTVLLHMLNYVPGVQEVYDEAVARRYRPLLEIYLIPIKEVLKKVDIEPRFLPLAPDHLKTQEMCKKGVEKYLWLLKYVPDCFLTH